MLDGARQQPDGTLGGVDRERVFSLLEAFSSTATAPSVAAHAQCLMAHLHLQQDEADLAVESYGVALECDPTCETAAKSILNLLTASGQPERLAAMLSSRIQGLRAVPDTDDDTLARLYRELAALRRERLGDIDGAIAAYNHAIDFDPDVDTIETLAKLYIERGQPGDEEQTADLYCAIGEALSGDDAIAYLERALDHMGDHADAMERLEALVPVGEQYARLRDRWAVYIERAGDDPDADERRVLLSRAHAAQGRYRDALLCIGPAAQRGDATAQALREAYLENLAEEDDDEDDTPRRVVRRVVTAAPEPGEVAPTAPTEPAREHRAVPMPAGPGRPPPVPAEARKVPASPARKVPAPPARQVPAPPARQVPAPPARQVPAPPARPAPVQASVPQARVSARTPPSPPARPQAGMMTGQPQLPVGVTAQPVAPQPVGAGAPPAAPMATPIASSVAPPNIPTAASTQPAASGAGAQPAASGAGAQPAASGAGARVDLVTSVAPRGDLSQRPSARPADLLASRGWAAAVAGACLAVAAGLILVLSSSGDDGPGKPTVASATRPPADDGPSEAKAKAKRAARSKARKAAARRRRAKRRAAAARRPKVRIARKAARFRGSAISQELFFDRVQKALPQVRKCYEKALARKPSLAGRIVYGVTLERGGKSTEVDRISGNLEDVNLGACGRAVLRQVRYPKPRTRRTSRVRLPLVFST